MNSQRVKTKSDYDDLYVADKETAEKQLIDAKEFISFIKSYIKQNKSQSFLAVLVHLQDFLEVDYYSGKE